MHAQSKMAAANFVNKILQLTFKSVYPSVTSYRHICTTDALSKKRRSFSKWKNSFPSTVYSEGYVIFNDFDLYY